MPTRPVDAIDGLDSSSITLYLAVLPKDILRAQLRPQAQKPDFIPLVEPGLVGHTSSRRRFSSIHKIRIGE
jgi:hypothetical protein